MVVLGETMTTVVTTITFTMNTTVATTIVGARDGDTVVAVMEGEAGPGAEAPVAGDPVAGDPVAGVAGAAEAAAGPGKKGGLSLCQIWKYGPDDDKGSSAPTFFHQWLRPPVLVGSVGNTRGKSVSRRGAVIGALYR